MHTWPEGAAVNGQYGAVQGFESGEKFSLLNVNIVGRFTTLFVCHLLMVGVLLVLDESFQPI